MPNVHHDIAERVQILSYFAIGWKPKEIAAYTGYSRAQICRIVQKAQERGFDPAVSRLIRLEYLEDVPRPGRPVKATVAKEEEVIQLATRDRYGRSKTTEQLGFEVGLSRETVRRILIRRGYSKCKPSTKPGLTPSMKQARLDFCIAHKDWTLKDWKRVVWTDETSVCLGHKRGSIRVWRTTAEGRRPVTGTIRNRWKGFSEFMFWGSFSCNYKGPCHI